MCKTPPTWTIWQLPKWRASESLAGSLCHELLHTSHEEHHMSIFHYLTRRAVVVVAALASAASVMPQQAAHAATTSSSQPVATPEGPGSASGAPYLPSGFTKTFASRYVDIGGLRLHAVIGGKGPPLLLVHGWPQTWYQWRLVMPELARNFTVIAVDQRRIGLSHKPQEGYDSRN